MSVRKAYQSLSSEQKHIIEEKKLDVTRPVGELLELLRPIAACDALVDKSKTKMGCTFGLAIVATIGLTILSFSDAGSWITWALVAAAIVIMVVSGKFWSWMGKIDVSNNFRLFALPVLTMFREDIAPGQPMHLRLDLGSPTDPTKKQSESQPYKAGVYHKVIDKMYRDPWMSAETLLVDGSKLSWTIVETIRERDKTKRNARGKTKTKTKYKKKTDIEVDLGLRNKLYEVHAPAGGEVTSDAKRTKVHVERRILSDSLDPIEPTALIDLIADVYRNSTLAPKEASA